MSKTIHIEFIGDFICPWCYLGKVRLERVRKRLLPEIKLEIDVKPYLLYPTMPKEGLPKAHFAKRTKPGMGKALHQEAKLENIAFNYRLIEQIPYSLEAHRLVWLIADKGQKYELSKLIFHDYFEQGQDISNKDCLTQLAESVGVEKSIIEQFLHSNKGEAAVQSYVQNCRSDFIRLVPYLKLNHQFRIPGLQSAEVWEKYIRRASRKREKLF